MQERMELVDGRFVMKGAKKEVKPDEKKPVVKQYSQEVIELRDRVIRGNQKLFEAWMQIRDIKDRDEKEEQLDKWNVAQDKLHHLCLELQAKRYETCLYIVHYEGLAEDEVMKIKEAVSEGKVTEVPGGVKTKNCISEPDGFWCQVCPSRYPYWQDDFKKL